jgi:hypothetical protein
MGGFQWFAFGVGGFALLCGLLIAIMRVRTLLSGRTADGVVVDLARGSTIISDGKSSVMQDPVVEFQHEGRKIRFKSSLGTEKGLPIGQHVSVRYLPSDPESSAEIGTFWRMFGFPLMTLLFAVLFIGAAAWDAGWLSGP